MSVFRSLRSTHAHRSAVTDVLMRHGDSICLSASEITAFNATVNANAPRRHKHLRNRRLAEWRWRLAAGERRGGGGGGGGGITTGLHGLRACKPWELIPEPPGADLQTVVIVPEAANCWLLKCFVVTQRPVPTFTAASLVDATSNKTVQIFRCGAPTFGFITECGGENATCLQEVCSVSAGITDPSLKRPTLAQERTQESSEAVRRRQQGVG